MELLLAVVSEPYQCQHKTATHSKEFSEPYMPTCFRRLAEWVMIPIGVDTVHLSNAIQTDNCTGPWSGRHAVDLSVLYSLKNRML